MIIKPFENFYNPFLDRENGIPFGIPSLYIEGYHGGIPSPRIRELKIGGGSITPHHKTDDSR
jgi:hypothetical protein